MQEYLKFWYKFENKRFESQRQTKRTFGHVRLAKIQISLHICAVWSDSSPGAFQIAKDENVLFYNFILTRYAKFLYSDNEDSIQTALLRRLIWIFVGHACQKLRILTLLHIFLFNVIILQVVIGVPFLEPQRSLTSTQTTDTGENLTVQDITHTIPLTVTVP